MTEQDSLLRADDEFSKIYNRNIKLIYQISLLFLGNISDAEDAAQTVFLKYIKSQMTFENLGHEKAWFVTVTRNHCRNIIKSPYRKRVVDIESIPEIKNLMTEDNKEESELLQQVLSLPPKYREILYLYYYMGYSVGEISSMLKRNESTIRTQLQKGRQKLKIIIEAVSENL